MRIKETEEYKRATERESYTVTITFPFGFLDPNTEANAVEQTREALEQYCNNSVEVAKWPQDVYMPEYDSDSEIIRD